MSKPDQLIGTVPTAYGMAGIHVGRYPIGGALAVQLYLASGEPLITFSTNLVPYGNWLADDEFFVKAWSENEPFVHPMLDTGLFEDTGMHVPSGYVVAPIWHIRNADHVPHGRRKPAPAAANSTTACPSVAEQRTQHRRQRGLR
jgi:hypothetical protein